VHPGPPRRRVAGRRRHPGEVRCRRRRDVPGDGDPRPTRLEGHRGGRPRSRRPRRDPDRRARGGRPGARGPKIVAARPHGRRAGAGRARSDHRADRARRPRGPPTGDRDLRTRRHLRPPRPRRDLAVRQRGRPPRRIVRQLGRRVPPRRLEALLHGGHPRRPRHLPGGVRVFAKVVDRRGTPWPGPTGWSSTPARSAPACGTRSAATARSFGLPEAAGLSEEQRRMFGEQTFFAFGLRPRPRGRARPVRGPAPSRPRPRRCACA
jgi:hypothetical protein